MMEILAEKERIRYGRTRKLLLSESHIAEYLINGHDLLQTTDRELKDDAGLTVVGYQFYWGQLVENKEEEILSWGIRFDGLHRDFLNGGGNGEELADLSIIVLGNLQDNGDLPDYLLIDDSDHGTTSVEIILEDIEYEEAARIFLADSFCYRLMPEVIESIRELRLNRRQ